MRTKRLAGPALSAWVGALIKEYRVFAPQAKGDRFAYDELRAPGDLRLDHDVTILPPKKYLSPPWEALLEFRKPDDFRSVSPAEKMLLFGVHPYDVAAIAQADAYYGQKPADTHYQERRANALIVACDVQNPSANVFAACMGTATVREGYDVLLTKVDGEYVAEARTPEGEALLAKAGALPDADAVSLGRREQVWADAQKLLRRHELKCKPAELPELLAGAYESKVWEKKSEKCYSCGSCVLVCPTCFCFDVQDDPDWTLQGGERRRQWDACLLRDFAVVAGNHNFRKQRAERFRHRFYRKGRYLPARLGFVACVGCGRCVKACTTNIANPVEVYNAILEDRA